MTALPIEPAEVDRQSPKARPTGAVVMRPRWRELLFAHWDFVPDEVQQWLPSGLQVDAFEGRAYIGLVPFRMENVRPHWVPNLGRLGRSWEDFAELNVRTYVVRNGVPGVWFFSLDAASALATLAARAWFGLPYFKARMRTAVAPDGTIRYWSKRLWPSPKPAICSARYRPVGPTFAARSGTLDEFLVERYVLYSRRGTQLYSGRVHHAPYPLRRVEDFQLRESCLAAADFERPPTAPHLLYSPGVDVEVWPLEKC